MAFDALFSAERVRVDVLARSKKHALELAAELLSDVSPDLAASDIFNALVARERLGCTSLGHGIALPHAALEAVEQGAAAVLRLRHPLEFDDDNDTPVSLIIAMVIPPARRNAGDSALQEACDRLGQRPFRHQLMQAQTEAELLAALGGDHAPDDVREAAG